MTTNPTRHLVSYSFYAHGHTRIGCTTVEFDWAGTEPEDIVKVINDARQAENPGCPPVSALVSVTPAQSSDGLLDAVKNMADTLSDSVSFTSETVAGLTCAEVETICAVYEAAGCTGAATDLRVAHAAHDDEDDQHFGFTDPDDVPVEPCPSTASMRVVRTLYPDVRPEGYATLEDWARDSDYEYRLGEDGWAWYQARHDDQDQEYGVPVDLPSVYADAMEAARS